MQWAATITILARLALGQQIEIAPAAKGPTVGTLLIATGKSQDADLKQSVVLVVHSGPEGVIGLILNHPVPNSAYFGGPIPIGMRTLVRSEAAPKDGVAIVKDVYMVSGKSTQRNSRVFAGYAGWTAQQLNDEIARALWTARPGDAAIVLDAHPDTLWRRMAR